MGDIKEKIIEKFLKANLQVHPDVVLAIQNYPDPDSLIDAIIKNVPVTAFVALPSHIPGYKNERYEPPLSQIVKPNVNCDKCECESQPQPTQAHRLSIPNTIPENMGAKVGAKIGADDENAYAKNSEEVRFSLPEEIEILSGAPSYQKPNADFNDFVYYFRDRYNKIAKLLRNRGEYLPISALTQTPRYRNQTVAIIGMVSEVRNTTKGHRIAVLEDPTDKINVLFINPQISGQSSGGFAKDPDVEKRKRENFEESEKLLPDEVIMVKGTLSAEGTILFTDYIFRPDIPLQNTPVRSNVPAKAVFISDVHVGSNTFLPAEWEKFSAWINTCGAEYLIIAGDVVDGIGIYPDQELELTIPNIYRQYEVFAQMLSKLPKNIKIIVSPGNHDAIRGSEPQPALTPNFTQHFPPNVILVENPALISIHGVRILMYHGRSYDDLISMIPGASYNEPQNMMVEMLKRRLLACTYGERTPIFPAKEDRLVIDPIPEILHTGHVHITGYKRYHGVICINAGTWQSQTSFQKQMNIDPNPARAYMVDLQTLKCELYDFTGDTPVIVE